MPLPHEKVVHTIKRVGLKLSPLPDGAPLSYSAPKHLVKKANGTVYLSNKRIAFVSDKNGKDDGKGDGGSRGNDDTAVEIDTFSLPLTHFHDGRFVQPWFGANYYEGCCAPAPGGGLDRLVNDVGVPPSSSSSSSPSFAVSFTFNEAGGFDFYETVEEMKQRISDGGHRGGSGTPREALRESSLMLLTRE